MPRHEKLSEINAPSWLTKAEKCAFRRLIKVQLSAGKAISIGQEDLLADYVAARSRIAALTRAWQAAVDEARGWPGSSERRLVELSSQIDATTALCRRLAEQLGLE